MIGFGKPPVETVEGVLADQRTALLAGDLDRLSRIGPELERALSRLQTGQVQANDIRRIRRAAARNAQLVQAARQGVAQINSMLHAQKNTALTTYDALGRSQATEATRGRTLARK